MEKEILRNAIREGLRRYEMVKVYGVSVDVILSARNDEEVIGSLNCRKIIRAEMARQRNRREGRPINEIKESDRYKGGKAY